MEELRLPLKGKEIKVVLEEVEGGEIAYSLRELTGKTRDEYLTSIAGKMKFDSEGKPAGVKSFDGLQAALLSRCMFTEDGDMVPSKTIQTFPSSTLSALFDRAQELSALNEEGVDAAKKD